MQKAATAQGITLKMLPTLFERRKANQTTVTQKSKIMWTLEWVFEEAEAKWIETGRADSDPIINHLENFLAVRADNVARRHRLKHYVKAGSDKCRHLRVFMVAEGRPANERGFYEVDVDQTLSELLCGKLVIEFPTLVVKSETEAAAIKIYPHPPKPELPPAPEPGAEVGGGKKRKARKRKNGGAGAGAAGNVNGDSGDGNEGDVGGGGGGGGGGGVAGAVGDAGAGAGAGVVNAVADVGGAGASASVVTAGASIGGAGAGVVNGGAGIGGAGAGGAGGGCISTATAMPPIAESLESPDKASRNGEGGGTSTPLLSSSIPVPRGVKSSTLSAVPANPLANNNK